MIAEVKQFVPSKVCLTCHGCCRFKEKESLWRPKITDDEIREVKQKDLLAEIYNKEKVDSSGHLKTVTGHHKGEHFCSCFNPKANTCLVYDVRPFECKLYPFVLVKRDSEIVLTVHHHCPYIQGHRNTAAFEEYVGYLKEFFRRKDILSFVQRNPLLAGEYPDYENELEYLFAIC